MNPNRTNYISTKGHDTKKNCEHKVDSTQVTITHICYLWLIFTEMIFMKNEDECKVTL